MAINEAIISLPKLKKIANPAPKLLLDSALSRGEDFIKFTAFAHVFDYESAKVEARRLLKIKSEFAKNNPKWVGEITLEQSIDATTRILSSVFDQQEYSESEHWLGLSSGYDSRFLLYALRNSPVNFRTFTFGEPGYMDYDLSELVSGRLSLNTKFVDLSKLDWSLDLFEKTITEINDKPLHARIKVLDVLVKQSEKGRISVIDGYLNGPLINLRRYSDWQAAKTDFIKACDQFKWHTFFDEKWLQAQCPDEPLVSEDELTSYDQFFLCLRGQRICPRDYGGIKYMLPYAQDEWTSFWLNRSETERESQNLFLKIVTQLQLEEFFDFNLLAKSLKPLNKNEQMRLIYGKGGLMTSRPKITSIDPFAQICFYSLYLGCESFRKMLNFSLTRLRKRQLFQPAAIDYIFKRFMKADPQAEKMMRGLITCDVALERNMYSEQFKGKAPL